MRVVVLVSGAGSNLQALIDSRERGGLAITLSAVISNRPGAGALQRADDAGIARETLDHRAYPSRAAFEDALSERIDAYGAELVVLAGFMRVLGAEMSERYRGRMINIHPSLLPALRGLHTHRRALASGAREHGCSVHFVTAELDGGPVIVQAPITISAVDTEQSLAERVQRAEHRILPLAVDWIATGRVKLEGQRIRLDGELRAQPPRLAADTVEPEAPST